MCHMNKKLYFSYNDPIIFAISQTYGDCAVSYILSIFNQLETSYNGEATIQQKSFSCLQICLFGVVVVTCRIVVKVIFLQKQDGQVPLITKNLCVFPKTGEVCLPNRSSCKSQSYLYSALLSFFFSLCSLIHCRTGWHGINA